MTKNWYFLIGNNHADIQSIRDECALRHTLNSPGSELSEVFSWSGNERLIKVANGDEAWQQQRDWINDLLFRPLQQGLEADDNIRWRWLEAQAPEFDGNEDGNPDTAQQRIDWWQTLPE
ncbi:MAG: hypothetical protein EYC62_02505 [Alphaproteobacteria bacterium]|nr:MAG: hypothetical protein EYC62_02505 [Alphaproteobacteria bacterium]